VDLGTETREGVSQCEPVEAGFTARNEILFGRGVHDDLDSLHGSILFKPDDRVNSAADTTGNAANTCFGASAHRIRNLCMMCVKNYIHF
jgi:hypothetical protein